MRFRSGWLVWIWLAVILFSQTSAAGRWANWAASLILGSGPGGGLWFFLAQKGFHVFLFSVFGWLLAATRSERPSWIAALWCVGVGLSAEALQSLSPGRDPQPADAALNVAAGLGAIALTVLGRSRRPVSAR